MTRRRELRIVRTEQVVGYVEVDGKTARFEGSAANVFGMLRRRLGDLPTADRLLDEGWSNGYLYLADQDPPTTR